MRMERLVDRIYLYTLILTFAFMAYVIFFVFPEIAVKG